MNDISLSKRLKTVASFVQKGARVADIGSDHAYLPVYLIKNGTAQFAVAGEVNKGPFQAALKQISKFGFEHAIQPKLGNGLSVMEGESIDTVTIAGMGGPLIADILDEGKERLTTVKRLILQPNIAADRIRRWLIEDSWELLDEVILKEDGHIYEVLVAEKGNPKTLYGSSDVEKEIWLGPKLLREKSHIFMEKWKRELVQLEKIQQQLYVASESENMEARKREIDQKITWLKEVLL
ncbi:tRNA (adenine(22)-N(1))-methyltransferase [Evansella tamaricis]|uniref:tRNA (Adenine(22)-N(1))-methyltransferase TrmK n=1 Tax=Evansella tamaricis TaxID=2069301 RepID=A0ABS6JEI4_9BACI|nr:tRNA (adenine(22)-N(1))-methyltransferase TrmK [Evansella tamaricis]MBU9712077.1 tRNA (adenine(22)-N(1))-methyltransferase TrmK [Evansella tamaricis]